MANERKIIRAAIKQALQNKIALPVFLTRNIDARNEDQFINVFFVDGQIEFDGVSQFTKADLTIAYRTITDADDDEIDAVSDQIHAALEETDIAPGTLAGLVPTGWEYVDDTERAFSGIYLRYSVTYTVN